MMARLKYDGYQDYVAGMRFLPSLVAWLQQFDTEDERRTAYEFVRNRLVYISPSEFQRLVELFFPDHVHRTLLHDVTLATNVEPYLWLASDMAKERYRVFLRQTLFLGLSDGARIDLLRRANAGRISNEQVVIATQIDDGKWQDLIKDLQRDLGVPSARFRTVYLIDDFTASGTSLIRKSDDTWKGKLARFFESVSDGAGKLFEEDWKLFVHHYIAGPGALETVQNRETCASKDVENWHAVTGFTAGIQLDPSVRIHSTTDAKFVALCEKYQNDCFKNRHTAEGGTDSVALGFGGCALPLVFEHNTPNNSVLLLWGDSVAEGSSKPLVRPLFRRRQRHGTDT